MDAMRVLLVDGDPEAAAVVQLVFEEGRREVRFTVLGDGDAALAHLLRQPPHAAAARPDLVLLELRLRGGSGLELLAEMKRQPMLRALPVVVLTSSSAADNITASYELGAGCYVEKPAELEALRAVLGTLRDFWLCTVRLP